MLRSSSHSYYQRAVLYQRTWIVVAHQGGARVFERRNRQRTLHLIEEFSNPSGRLQAREIKSDRPGRSYSSSNHSFRHSLSSTEEPTERVARAFAGVIAHYLDQARQENRYDSLVLIAEPRFLGRLRSQLKRSVLKIVSREVEKDLANSNKLNINKYIY